MESSPQNTQQNMKGAFGGRWKLAAVCLLAFLVGATVGAALLYRWTRSGGRSASTEAHTITGEVFLQLADGQVRHAPGATVYVFDVLDPVARRWSEVQLRFIKAMASGKAPPKKLVEALQLVPGRLYAENPSSDTVPGRISVEARHSLNCDSTGRFTLKLPSGGYWVVATGRAGFNEAVWSGFISVPQDRSVSLGEPLASYFDYPSRD